MFVFLPESSENSESFVSTDYAITIFNDALTSKQHKCYLRDDTRLPMMYLDDAIRATIEFLEADKEKLKIRSYNVAAMSFTPEELATEIRRYVPELEVNYIPDQRQEIGNFLCAVFFPALALLKPSSPFFCLELF